MNITALVLAMASFFVWVCTLAALYLMYLVARDCFRRWLPTVYAAMTLGHVMWLIRRSNKGPITDLAALTQETMAARTDYDFLMAHAETKDGYTTIRIPNAKNSEARAAVRRMAESWTEV